jgi:CPA2 family monovalent cation:H+ antiporter-2
MEIRILQDIAIIFGLAIIVLLVCHRIRLPSIIGFLLTGIVVGPNGFHLIRGLHEVDVLAEIGVVLLLFTIGLEFSFGELVRIKRTVLVGGSLQVLLTIIFAATAATAVGGLAGRQAVFAGFLLALSSTAIVVKMLQEKGEIDSLHGKTILGILIFQDIVVVLLMLTTPILAGTGDGVVRTLLLLAAKGLGLIGFVILATRFLVPRILYLVARTRNRELFLVAIVSIGLFTAWLTSLAGLSIGLGAFLAGLVISESEYSEQALGGIMPFRDIFISFFFVSVGMLLKLDFVLAHSLAIGQLTLAVMIGKVGIVLLVTGLLGLPLRAMLLSALALFQIGEFSFVLSRVGMEYGLLVGQGYQYFLAVTVLTMALTPLLARLSHPLTELACRLPLPDRLRSGLAPVPVTPAPRKEEHPENHLVIVGYGLNGRHLSQAAKAAGISYLIVETNPDIVRRERKNEEPIYYGDASHEAVLAKTGIDSARVAVIAISDPVTTRRIAKLAKELNPGLYLIARTRFVVEMEPLYRLGVDEVIPEEFETAVEIFTRVLTQYLVPVNDIDRFIAEIRADGYKMFRRRPAAALPASLESYLPGAEVRVVRVEEGSTLAGHTIAEIGLRKNYGVTVLGVRRDAAMESNPGPGTTIETDDLLVLFGTPENLGRVMCMIRMMGESCPLP